MVKIDAEPLHFCSHDLDLKCFPDLYPYRMYGQRHQRDVRLRDFDYIRSRLTSKHPQFRLNKQYLFFLLLDYYIRSLNGGIFHMLNVVDPTNKLTAGNFREKLHYDERNKRS